MSRLLKFPCFVLVLALSSCVSFPTGPSVMSLPGTDKSFEAFRADDAVCRQFALEQMGGTGKQAAQSSAVTSAAVSTIVGAAAGAAIGSASGDMGAGAAVGAGSGLILGSAAGSGSASGSFYENQRRYDNAYIQCMYAKGNRVPVSGRFTEPTSPAPSRWDSPPPADYPPPPRPW